MEPYPQKVKNSQPVPECNYGQGIQARFLSIVHPPLHALHVVIYLPRKRRQTASVALVKKTDVLGEHALRCRQDVRSIANQVQNLLGHERGKLGWQESLCVGPRVLIRAQACGR